MSEKSNNPQVMNSVNLLWPVMFAASCDTVSRPNPLIAFFMFTIKLTGRSMVSMLLSPSPRESVSGNRRLRSLQRDRRLALMRATIAAAATQTATASITGLTILFWVGGWLYPVGPFPLLSLLGLFPLPVG